MKFETAERNLTELQSNFIMNFEIKGNLSSFHSNRVFFLEGEIR